MGKAHLSIKVLEIMLRSIENIGIDNTIKLLEAGQTKFKENYKEVIEFMIATTCAQFNLSKTELFNGTSKNERTDALSICFVMLAKHLHFKQSAIAEYFDKDISNVSRYSKRICMLSPDSPSKYEKELFAKYKTVSNRVENFIKELKSISK